jgi:nucleotide-binding universal stress UspA family protein
VIKDIAVHLTGSSEDKIRIAHAAGVARTLDAHLTGIYLHQLPDVLSITDPSGSAFLQRLVEQSVAQAEATTEALDCEFGQLGLTYEIRRLDVYPRQVGHILSSEARQSDLFVGTRPYGDPNKGQWIEEAVLFQSGRPCLFLPPAFQGYAVYRNVLVAWKSTREAARAVADAMPLLKKAKSVVVAIVDEDLGAAEEQGRAPDADIGRYMSRHGINAEVHVVDGWTSPGAAILNEAVRTAADLVVMGAYGHSRLREWMLGGVTRDVLKSAAVPVLVAH